MSKSVKNKKQIYSKTTDLQRIKSVKHKTLIFPIERPNKQLYFQLQLIIKIGNNASICNIHPGNKLKMSKMSKMKNAKIFLIVNYFDFNIFKS